MHAHDRIPIQFIFLEFSAAVTAELSGSSSGTLPMLGSGISLDSSELVSKDEAPDAASEKTEDETTRFTVFPVVFLALELDVLGAEDLAGGALLAFREEEFFAGAEPAFEEPVPDTAETGALLPPLSSSAKAPTGDQQAKKASNNRTDNTFSRRFIKSPPPHFHSLHPHSLYRNIIAYPGDNAR